MPCSGPKQATPYLDLDLKGGPRRRQNARSITLHGGVRPRGQWEHDAQVKHGKEEGSEKLKEQSRQEGGSRPTFTEARPGERPWKESPVELQNRRCLASKMPWWAKEEPF